MATRTDEVVAGFRDIIPAMLSVFPIGVIVGITANRVGMTDVQAIWMSLTIYTGLAQAAMLDLLADDTPAVIVVLAGLLINLRLLMYSASLAARLEGLSLRQRFSHSYLLLDVVYALSIATFRAEQRVDERAYYLGAGIGAWLSWQLGTIVGVTAGNIVPSGLNLTFAIPLVFIALLVPVLDDRPSIGAGLVGGGIAVLAAGLPFDLGLLVGAITGITAGVALDVRGER